MHRYRGKRLSYEEVLQAFSEGLYRADLTNGIIYSGITLQPLRIGRVGRSKEYFAVKLYCRGKAIHIKRSRVIWMVGTGCVIPPGFEVDHDNGDPEDDSFDNLICLHKLDHRKRRHTPVEDEVPF